jgi:chromosome segregation ATPase
VREKVESELRRVRESYSVLENARRQEEQRTTEKEKELAALREAVGAGEREKETLHQQLLALRESLSNRSPINHTSTILYMCSLRTPISWGMKTLL